jgi:hypothetical protein
VDHQWQVPVTWRIARVGLVYAVLTAGANYALSTPQVVEGLSGPQMTALGLLLSVGLAVVMLVLLTFLGLRITHSVAGAARVLEQAVRGMSEGRFDLRLTLRKRDYLHSLAGALQDLRARLETEEKEGAALTGALQAALERGDLEEARGLAQQLSRARGVGSAEEREDLRGAA